ncbi:FkbM family methyltransferase [Algoriphagus sp.]|uniref:FkbM family methyltransferase n=1 Tax=Algoriphagus sp. TaxID=1872435 RepID=UPI0039195505
MGFLTSTFLRKVLMKASGYYIYKIKDLPIGIDLWIDLENKIQIPLLTVFDIGANVGSFSEAMIQNHPNAKIFVFEPVQSTYENLVKNLGNISNVNFNKIALGDTEEKVMINFYEEENSVLNSLNPLAMNPECGKKEEIEVQRGDEFCIRHNITHINLLKIDTEGFELNVLSGFSNMLKTNSIDLIYLETGFDLKNKRNTYFSKILDHLNEQGYQMFGLYEISNWSICIGENYGNALFIHSNITKDWGFVKR